MQEISSSYQRVIKLFQTTYLLPTQIAKEIGISRERVRQLLVKAGLPTSREEVCSICNRPTLQGSLCHRHKNPPRRKAATITIICHTCKKERTMLASDVRRSRKVPFFFCSKKCYGIWWGSTYGFKRKERGEIHIS